MKGQVAEYLKLMGALGPLPGLQVGFKKLASHGEFSVKLPGLTTNVWIRKGTSDWSAFKQVFIWKEYEYPLPFVPSTILDAGSNVGLCSTLVYSQISRGTDCFLRAGVYKFRHATKKYRGLQKHSSR